MPAHQNNISGPPVSFHLQIGVTGHRDLALTAPLEKSLANALTIEIKKLLGWNENKQTPISYSILSPLAEGADRFVAKAAIRLLDAELEAVLPMSKEEYMEDFTSPESCTEFETLWEQAGSHHQTITKALAEAFPGKQATQQRILAYKKVGHYVVDHCDVLLAIWDGEPAKSEAGTGAVVAYANETGKTIIIINPKNPNDTSQPKHKKKNCTLAELYNKYEQFNTYPIDPVTASSAIKKLSDDLFSNPHAALLNPKNIEAAHDLLMPWFVRADTIAVKSQKIYERVGFLIYVLSPVAVALVALGILVHRLSWLFFPLEFLILLFAYSAITLADRPKVHKKWIECRYLAEHTRCAIYFAACGFRPEVIRNTMQAYHRHQTSNWAAKMFNQVIKDKPGRHHYQHTDTRACAEFIKMCWIEGQITFHANKAVHAGKKGRQLEFAGKIVFFTALVAALTHIILAWFHFEDKTSWVERLATFIAISFPALGASLGAIRIHREYSRLSRQSTDMVKQLESLKRECDELSTQHEFSAFLVKTQEKMLKDVQGWLSLMELIILDAV